MDSNFSCFSGNLSKDYLSDMVWSLDPIVSTDIATRYIITIVCFLLIALGLPWNGVVIAIIVKKKLYKEEPAIVLLLNLAITDLLLCILVMPFNLVPGITGEFSFGSNDVVRCKACQVGVLFIILMLVLLNNFALMSIDRLIYIRWAMHYHMIIKPWRVAVVVLIFWLVSIITALPPLFGFGELQFSTAVGICTIKFSGSTPVAKNIYYVVVLLIVVLIPLVMLVVTNSWVVCIAQKHMRNAYSNTKMERRNVRKSFYQELKKRHTTVQINFIKIYTAIFITFILTWTPILIRIFASLAAEGAEFTPTVRVGGVLAYLALLSQVVLHPTLLAVLIQEVRKNLIKNVKKLKRKLIRTSVDDVLEDSVRPRRNSGDKRSCTSCLRFNWHSLRSFLVKCCQCSSTTKSPQSSVNPQTSESIRMNGLTELNKSLDKV